MDGVTDISITIRSFQPGDQEACQSLYRLGLIKGALAENDTGLDIDDIDSAYMSTPGSHFWVAENDAGEVVGMIGVQHHDEGTGEIRRLRVRPDHLRRGIGSALLETAIRHCQESGHLKVTLDTYTDREPAIHLFEKFRFKLQRQRKIGERDMLYFYLDLYMEEKRK